MSPELRVPAVTSPLTCWPPPAAAAAAPPSCAAAGPGTVKGPEPPLCSPTAFYPPPSPNWDPKGLRGAGDTQDRAEALLEPAPGAIPLGKDTVSSRALAITRFSIICRCRDSVCGAGGELGTSTHTPGTAVGSRGPPGTLSLPGCQFYPAPSSSPAPHLPGMSSAQPGLGSAAPPAPRRPPSASGSAGRPPPAGSAPWRNSLSTHHRAQDTCQDHILLLDSPGRHGATASPCVTVLAKLLVF